MTNGSDTVQLSCHAARFNISLTKLIALMNDYSHPETPRFKPRIIRHEPRPANYTPASTNDSAAEEITEHIRKHIGEPASVWHELISDAIHIDIHVVAPTSDRPYWTLVTSGMSDLPMAAPARQEAWRYTELMLCLPPEWQLSEEAFKDESNYWPLYWLKHIARFPHAYHTWVCWGHSIPNGDPARPMHSTVPFTGVVLLRPMTVSTEFWTLEVRPDKLIQFFALVPLHPSEMMLKLSRGTEALEALFQKHKVTELIKLDRPDMVEHDAWDF